MKSAEEIKRNYDQYYDDNGDWEWRRLSATGKADNIIQLCRGLPQHSVLEIGAGEGAVLQRLSELGFGDELYGLEISSSGLAVINNRGIIRLTECVKFDGDVVPYPDGRFDIAILCHVIEHLDNPRQLIREAARVARYVFIEVPAEDTIRLPRDFVANKVGHINFYSDKTIRLLVQSCGLRVIEQITSNPPKEVYRFQGRTKMLNFTIKEILMRISPALAKRLFCFNEALICETQ